MNYDTTIFRECNIRLSKDTATIDEPVYVFKGDRNIKLKFNLQGLKYKFSEHPLDIYFETQQAAFCQVKWYRADDVKITFDIQSCDGGMPVLVIGEELMDEDVELGSYSIQIRLLDYNKNSILTLPLIENAVTIKAPVFEEGETEQHIAKIDEGEVGTAKLSVRGVVEDTYNIDGTYNKTTWNTGDIIAANKLNKSENAIEDIVGRINTLETTGGQQGPAGPQGEKGDKGDPGENGQTPNITIGTVTTVSSSTEASAEITGSTPNLVLNLSIPKGERGPEGTGGSGGTGADPTITIGTVTSGAVASASITGDYPDYTLNLVLPKGADGQDGTNGVDGVDGKDGLTTSIIINGVTYKESNGEITLPAYPIVPTKVSELSNDSQYVTENDITNRGYATTADIPTKLSELTDDVGHITLDDIPKATNNTAGIVKVDGTTLDTDADGTLKYIGTVADTPTLTVGTVTKGDNAAASISGTAPNYTLDLTLPKGDAGEKGDAGNTVAVSVNGSTYSHINGTITLPDYPTPRTDDEIKSLADGQISAKMTTTINSSSTDTQVPSAKSIYNKSKNKITKISGIDIITYANSITSESVTDTVRIMNGINSPYGTDNTANDFHYTIYNIGDNDGYKRIVAYDIRKNDMYMNIKRNDAWLGWTKVCTTKVADVGETNITFSDSTNYKVSGSNCKYIIKNGICTMMLYLNCVTPVTSWVTVANVPKPSNISLAQTLTSVDGTSIMRCFIKMDGGLQLNLGTAGTTFVATISYPVAEE